MNKIELSACALSVVGNENMRRILAFHVCLPTFPIAARDADLFALRSLDHAQDFLAPGRAALQTFRESLAEPGFLCGKTHFRKHF